MQLKDVKIKKVVNKNSIVENSVNIMIEFAGKKLSLTVNADLDYILIHHDTTFTDVIFSSVRNDVKVKELNDDGSVYSIGLNAKL